MLDTAVATEDAVTEANAARSSNERQKRRRAAAAERGVDNDVLRTDASHDTCMQTPIY